MRGVHSVVDEIRRNVFTEVARLAYEGGDLNRVDMIPYKLVPGRSPTTATTFSWSGLLLPRGSVWRWAWTWPPASPALP